MDHPIVSSPLVPAQRIEVAVSAPFGEPGAHKWPQMVQRYRIAGEITTIAAPFFSDPIEAARHMTYGPRTLHRGAFLELVDRDGWEYAHRFATLGIVVVVAVDHGALLLVEQFRVAQNAAVLTLPGGLVDAQDAVDGGDPFGTAAARELIEETGFSAEHLTLLGEGPASPGMTTEHIRFYRAEGVRRIGRALGDGDERLTVHCIPLADLRQFMASRQDVGVQIDVKLWAGLFLAGQSEPDAT